MTDINEVIERRKMLKGMKDLGRMCHCGKLRVNHTIPEANQCKKNTDSIGKIMTSEEINDMKQMKL